MAPDFSPERQSGGRVAGIDEVGRGPWAGPVVAAAVILEPDHFPDDIAARLDDSKKLTPRGREYLYTRLHAIAEIGLGQASVAEITAFNILQASLLAMRRAVAALPQPPDRALIDGHRLPALPMPGRCIVGGDGVSFSIAAASVIAKVTRDGLMGRLARIYPGYGWERNAGYGTPEHRCALSHLGLTPEHRRGFRPIRALIDDRSP